ncbi:hypothetical protein VTP01DRAFT_4130 [Rhizomucor pusillus]|uniref:uncharacterized protein n=1 Tax=Rhizomucor pusillus TaxID=4840 RepID=UPI003744A735
MSATQEKNRESTIVIEKVASFSSPSTTEEPFDRDAQRLKDLGYKQEFNRDISLFTQAGFAFTTMAVLPNWLVGFGASMSAGGPMSLFWGYIVVIPFVTCIALSMAEVFSAYPVNGGVYSWCYLLSNKKWGPLMSWICGYVFVAGLLAATMTLAYNISESVISIANLYRENPITSQGAYVGLYVLFIVVGVAYSGLGLKFSGYLNNFMVFWVAIGTIIVVIAMPVMAPTHPSAEWVFTEFQNTTGYQNYGLVFLIGLLQAGWTFLGYENGAQIAEGTKNADITGPRGIILAVGSAMIQGVVLCIATLFSIQDVEELRSSAAPVATLFLRATNRPLTVFFLVILALTQFASECNSFYSCAQLLWAMSRDKCIPLHSFWYKLSGKNKVPARILILEGLVCIVVIMPSFASEVYWSAIMSTAVICINVAYGLPNFCRLIWTRRNMQKGPFNLGRYSVPINIFAVVWIAFFTVILCIPAVFPVAPETMNWTCLMIGVVLIFSLGFWFVQGRHSYVGPIQTLEADHGEH